MKLKSKIHAEHSLQKTYRISKYDSFDADGFGHYRSSFSEYFISGVLYCCSSIR